MTKPTTVPTALKRDSIEPHPTPNQRPPKLPAAKRIVAVQTASNEYTVIEETYDCVPTSTRVVKEKCARVPAEDRVRLWHEIALGHDRFGDSGL